jgi:transposase
LQESAADVFGGPPKNKPAEPDLKVLHAKIGELTLENEWYGRFLSATGYQSGVGI